MLSGDFCWRKRQVEIYLSEGLVQPPFGERVLHWEIELEELLIRMVKYKKAYRRFRCCETLCR